MTTGDTLPPDDPRADLATVRDWLRYAVSAFNAAGLTYGHGTTRALDEAAFLLLTSLNLPIDELDPWLDCRLTLPERTRILDLIRQRIATRKPLAYLLGQAWIQGHRFRIDERVIVPRSFIGELLGDGLSSVVADPDTVQSVLDVCTGSGCLAILAALTFPQADVDATDLSADALAVARANVDDYGLAERVRLVHGDLLAGLAGRRYDLILANPPYVAAAEVAAFPPEHRAEPLMAHAGGADGLDLVRRILAVAGDHLTPEGHLVMEIGTGRALLEEERPDLPFLWLDTAESEGEVFVLPAAAFAGGKSKSSAAFAGGKSKSSAAFDDGQKGTPRRRSK